MINHQFNIYLWFSSGCLISCTYEWLSGEESLAIIPRDELQIIVSYSYPAEAPDNCFLSQFTNIITGLLFGGQIRERRIEWNYQVSRVMQGG